MANQNRQVRNLGSPPLVATLPKQVHEARTGSEALPEFDTTTRATAARTIAMVSAAARAGRLDAARAGATAWKLSILSHSLGGYFWISLLFEKNKTTSIVGELDGWRQGATDKGRPCTRQWKPWRASLRPFETAPFLSFGTRRCQTFIYHTHTPFLRSAPQSPPACLCLCLRLCPYFAELFRPEWVSLFLAGPAQRVSPI